MAKLFYSSPFIFFFSAGKSVYDIAFEIFFTTSLHCRTEGSVCVSLMYKSQSKVRQSLGRNVQRPISHLYDKGVSLLKQTNGENSTRRISQTAFVKVYLFKRLPRRSCCLQKPQILFSFSFLKIVCIWQITSRVTLSERTIRLMKRRRVLIGYSSETGKASWNLYGFPWGLYMVPLRLLATWSLMFWL